MKKHDSIEELNRLLKVRLQEGQFGGAEQPKFRPIITITSEPGSRGEAIAKKLASELDLRLYDWELIEQIAKDEHVSAGVVSMLERNPPDWFADFLAALNPEHGLTSDRYVARLKSILLAIAVVGNAVIVGRGSNFFFAADKKIGLCFIAPLELRVNNIVEDMGLTEKAAHRHIATVEAEHRKLLKKYLTTEIRDPSRYHLVINTALVNPETVVQLAKALIHNAEVEKGELV